MRKRKVKNIIKNKFSREREREKGWGRKQRLDKAGLRRLRQED